MPIEKILFYLFSSVAILSSLMVIFATNPVHSALFLIVTFCNASFILFLIGAEYIGLIFIMVYVGAIAVLFLFVVMMLDIRRKSKEKSTKFDIFIMVTVGFLLCLEMFFMIENTYSHLDQFYTEEINDLKYISLYYAFKFKVLGGMKVLGVLLYNFYSFYFFLAGLILLVAMVGVIVLTASERDFVRRQNDYDQINRDFRRCVFEKIHEEPKKSKKSK